MNAKVLNRKKMNVSVIANIHLSFSLELLHVIANPELNIREGIHSQMCVLLIPLAGTLNGLCESPTRLSIYTEDRWPHGMSPVK